MFDVEDHGQALYARVVRAELARRLPYADIRVFAPFGPDRPTRSDRGEPAEALGPWSPARLVELAEQLDLVVVGGHGLLAADEETVAWYGADLAPDCGRYFLSPGDVPVRWHATGASGAAALRDAGVAGPIDVTPHPALLAPRLFPAAVLARRLGYLRVMDWYPREQPALVVEGAVVPDVATVLRLLDDHPRLTLVVTDVDGYPSPLVGAVRAAGRPAHRLPSTVSQEDVAAAISAAGAYIASSPGACVTAQAYGVPWVVAGKDLADAVAWAVKVGPDEEARHAAQAEVDAWLDLIAEQAVQTAASRRGPVNTPRGALEAELRALRMAHRVRTERANAERVLLADLVTRAESELSELRPEVVDLRQRVATESARRAEAEAELTALRRTRTFRWTSAARALYRKVGGGR